MSDKAADTEDSDPNNMLFRAGYLQGLAKRLEGDDDREMVLRASRSLIYAVNALTAPREPPEGQTT